MRNTRHDGWGRPDGGAGNGSRFARARAAVVAPTARRAVLAVLVATLAVTGCSASDDDSAGASDQRPSAGEQGKRSPERDGTAETRQPGSDPSPGASDGTDQSPGRQKYPAASRELVRTAQLTVVAKDVPGKLERARETAEKAGGYTASETTDRDPEGHERSRITLKVPPRKHSSVLADLSDLGTLERRNVSTQDVTDRVVDLKSQISSQRASVRRVRELMDEADDLSEVVRLEGQLTSRQTTLETLLAEQKNLSDSTDMATVILSLREPDGTLGGGDRDESPGFVDALAGGWGALLFTMRWFAVVLGALLPFVLAGALLTLLWRVLEPRRPRWLRRRPRVVPVSPWGPPAAPAPAPVGADGATTDTGDPDPGAEGTR
ncbi:DUF4349 domain-containing protein [Streptomyces sp. NPDC005438]|uniref:DUF4349 domain-containing protein n=1 Tax=Streptomyces sp. NPDC005438 TaxID=3156880 RepID=UPI0033A0DD22